MTGFNHTLMGSLIGVIVPPPCVPIVALVSHFVLDAVPHSGQNKWAYIKPDGSYSRGFKIQLIIDATLCFAALFFAIWLFPEKRILITIGAFFAAGPDFLWLFQKHAKDRLTRGFYTFASKIQWAELPWGWILEIAYAICFIGIMLWIDNGGKI